MVPPFHVKAFCGSLLARTLKSSAIPARGKCSHTHSRHVVGYLIMPDQQVQPEQRGTLARLGTPLLDQFQGMPAALRRKEEHDLALIAPLFEERHGPRA